MVPYNNSGLDRIAYDSIDCNNLNSYPAEWKYLTSIRPDFINLNDIGWDVAGSNY